MKISDINSSYIRCMGVKLNIMKGIVKSAIWKILTLAFALMIITRGCSDAPTIDDYPSDRMSERGR